MIFRFRIAPPIGVEYHATQVWHMLGAIRERYALTPRKRRHPLRYREFSHGRGYTWHRRDTQP